MLDTLDTSAPLKMCRMCWTSQFIFLALGKQGQTVHKTAIGRAGERKKQKLLKKETDKQNRRQIDTL